LFNFHVCNVASSQLFYAKMKIVSANKQEQLNNSGTELYNTETCYGISSRPFRVLPSTVGQ